MYYYSIRIPTRRVLSQKHPWPATSHIFGNGGLLNFKSGKTSIGRTFYIFKNIDLLTFSNKIALGINYWSHAGLFKDLEGSEYLINILQGSSLRKLVKVEKNFQRPNF